MKKKLITIFSLIFLISALSAKGKTEVTSDLGNPALSGVYNTEPLRLMGRVAWKTTIKGSGFMNTILKDSVLYVTSVRNPTNTEKSPTGFMYAINSVTGKIIWEDSISNQLVSSPVLKGDMLYYGECGTDAKQLAVDRITGKIIWEFAPNKSSCYAPAVVGDLNFFGSLASTFYVINNNTRKLVKKFAIDAGVACHPSVYNSKVYYVDVMGVLRYCDARTLENIRVYNSNSMSHNAPAIVDGIAYLSNETGTLAAIDLDNQRALWTDTLEDNLPCSASVKDGIAAIITAHGHIYAIDIKTGNIVWDRMKARIGNAYTSIAGDILYVGSPDRYLYAYDLKTGIEIWSFGAENPVNTPLIDNKMVYFTSGQYVYALK